jgi:hypothetical protein
LIPGHGVFCASASSYYSSSLKPYNAFNKITTSGTSPWISSGNPDTFDELTGLASTADSFEGTSGPWIKLKLPYNVKPKKVQMFMRTTSESSSARKPKSGIVYGLKDGTYHRITNFDFGSTDKDIPLEEVNLNTHDFYSEFVLQITSMYLTGISTDAIAIKGINYFGTPGPTTLDKGSLSLTRSLDVPRISRYDVDTETPRPEKLVVDFDTTVNSSPTDISGQGNHGTLVGATYSAADKAFVFDGTDDSIRGIISNPAGDWVHSISFWFKLGIDQSTISGRIDPFTIGRQGTGGVSRTTNLPDGDLAGHYSSCDITPTAINWYFYGNDASFNISGIKANEWHHLTFAYEGGGAVANRHAYFDGVEYPNVGTSTAELEMFANSILALGVDFGRVSSSPSYFNGQLSNFKIYNAFLEPSEVKKLYKLGRTGRSMVISDTAVGIGKVPEAQLDVRGIGKFETCHIRATDIDISATHGIVDISQGARTAGSQNPPSHTPPLYITGNIGSASEGVEFRHFNQSQGIGFGYNTIYATGHASGGDQDLSLKAYGSGVVRLDGGDAITSDDRLKTNEEYLTNATETLLKLKPQLYDKHKKINETCENPMREAGLITQDVYYDAPELRFLVHARNKGMDAIIPVNIPEEKPFVDDDPTKDPDYSGWGTDAASLNYGGLIPYLIKSNQEIYNELQAEKAHVSDLLERVTALENA